MLSKLKNNSPEVELYDIFFQLTNVSNISFPPNNANSIININVSNISFPPENANSISNINFLHPSFEIKAQASFSIR